MNPLPQTLNPAPQRGGRAARGGRRRSSSREPQVPTRNPPTLQVARGFNPILKRAIGSNPEPCNSEHFQSQFPQTLPQEQRHGGGTRGGGGESRHDSWESVDTRGRGMQEEERPKWSLTPPPRHEVLAKKLEHKTHTLKPTPKILHPTPYTLHPTPHTLHPTPYTLARCRYRGTSLMRNSLPLGPRSVPMALQCSQGGGQLLMSEVQGYLAHEK